MAEIIKAGVFIFTAVIATKVFLRSRSRDSNGGVVPEVDQDASSSPPPPPPSSSSSSGSWKYDVFLSFRGEDTRKTFVDHLYSALQQHHILTYKDDVTLDRGDTMGPALLTAIRESNIALIIFSENYADSSWCLDELSHIMKCKEEDSGQTVIPVFYGVDPWDVRKQRGHFGKAFAKHKLSENNKNKVESWRKALVDASNIAGWEIKHVTNGHEARYIQQIVHYILDKLSSSDSTVEDENLVGMGIRLEKLKSQLRIGSGGVRMVGIWGLGGGGKTTLATSLYKKFSPNFDGCCFLGDIREDAKRNGLKSLQEKILSTVFDKPMQVQSVELGKDKIKQMLYRRKVLIVLDDVDHPDQLKALAGCPKWFGDGSRIIITTRDQHLLLTHRVEVSPISLLSREEAARLLRRHAYHEDNPVQDYEELSQQIVTYAAGLPLALIVLGSFLYDKDKGEWLSTLDRLKYIPETDILEKLKISYDGLKDEEKEIFLDIACFFRKMAKVIAMRKLDAFGFHSAIGVKVLIQKALISITPTCIELFDMHDLVQEMAHYIVRGEHPKNPEKHSRIWRKEDIEDICFRNATMENDKIEAIRCFADVSSSNFITFLSNMKKLRYLGVKTTSFDEGPRFLSNELRYIEWYGYPASPFPESFQQTKLVYLRTECSLQKELWKGYKYLPYLKKLKLADATELLRTPDIGGLPCLQKLILNTCDSLEEIHQSLGNHSSLIRVSVKRCKKLTRFPTIVKMDKLEILEISECEALIEFPKIEANMDNLLALSLEWVSIEIIPSTIVEYCTNLTWLHLNYCSNLKRIDGNFHALKGLKNFQSKGCKQFEMLPIDLFNENLDELFLDSRSIKLIRSSMARFLRKLDLRRGGLKDGDMPDEIGELSNLRELHLRANDFTRLGFSLSRLTRLKLLDLSWCENLVELPELPSSLAILMADNCKSLEVIKDDAHTRCKWLCGVSIWGWRGIITGGERLLESMLQGEVVKSGSMLLQLNGSEIPRGFEPRLVRGERCRMQLPENWYNHFFGFLFCVFLDHWDTMITTRIKHDKSVVDDRMEKNNDDRSVVVDWLEGSKCVGTRVGYISFGSLRNTLWWDQTSTAIEFEFHSELSTIIGCGCKIIPKRSETTIITDSSSFDDVSNDYNCKLKILHDSESTFKVVYIDNAVKYL